MGMGKTMRKLIFLAVLALAVGAWGADHCILDGGSGDGSAWNNALDDLPATLIRGDRYYIADGNYDAYNFDDAVSGNDTIFILKATESTHGSETGWNSSYGDGQAIFSAEMQINASYMVINGITGAEENGASYGFKFFYSTESENNSLLTSSSGSLSSYVTLSYINFEQSGIDHDPDIKSTGIEADNISYWTISHCYIHHSNSALSVFSNGATNLTFEYNYFCERH
jgi:hypothetical protein